MSKTVPDSRRAVSPVIATVILIAVAVALGIAVAVWAGALTGGLQRQEKLIVFAYQSIKVGGGGGGPAPSSITYLNISITNQSPGTAAVTQVIFNSKPQSAMNPGGSFTYVPAQVLTGPYALTSGASGTIGITAANLGTPKSGITYPITLVTAAGNSYPITIAWP